MANPRGVFTEELVPEGWFDETAQAAGWFDQDNVDVAAASGSPYSLPVSTAAVTRTGSTIALRRALKLSVSTAAVTLTGSSVALRTARKLAVATSAVTLTGSTISAKATRRLAVSTAAVTLTGSDITLTYASPNKRLTVESGTITLTGSEIALSRTTVGAPVTETYTGGSLNYLNPRKYRIEKEEEREELRKEIVRIGEASQSEVITGIVQTPRKTRNPNVETLARVAQQRREAEQARQEQIRRQIAADDEWLMLA